jgi:hypothetical protein
LPAPFGIVGISNPGLNMRSKVDGPVCIARATDGKRKIACVIEAGDHVRFHMDMFTVIKANTEALKKPKRVKRAKSAAA